MNADARFFVRILLIGAGVMLLLHLLLWACEVR